MGPQRPRPPTEAEKFEDAVHEGLSKRKQGSVPNNDIFAGARLSMDVGRRISREDYNRFLNTLAPLRGKPSIEAVRKARQEARTILANEPDLLERLDSLFGIVDSEEPCKRCSSSDDSRSTGSGTSGSSSL